MVECFIEWVHEKRPDGNAWKILLTLAEETSKVANSVDASQREFEVLHIAEACEPETPRDHEAAKRWFMRAEPVSALEARKVELEEYFAGHGHSRGLALLQRKTSGRYRASWYFSSYDIAPTPNQHAADVALDPNQDAGAPLSVRDSGITYDVTKPGEIQLSWLGRMVLGKGAFKTRSGRGVLWATWMFLSGVSLLSYAYLFFAMRGVNRPLQTNDLIILMALFAIAWVTWRMLLRPMIWLLEDRLILAGDLLMKFKEDSAQLDMAKDDAHRYIRLVRYSAVCSVCAGDIELRYGHGQNQRRIFGCCSEVPTEHVFTFDRVTRMGQRWAT